MFCLNGRDAATKYDSSSNDGNFGWWLGGDRETATSSTSRCDEEHRSSGSSGSSMLLSCIDSDDSYVFAQNMSQRERQCSESCEKIELSTFAENDLDVDAVDVTAEEENTSSGETRPVTAQSYTPERLIRSQEYRILIPSVRRFSLPQPRIVPTNESLRKSRRCRKRLSSLINPNQIDAAQLRDILNLSIPHVRTHAVSSPIERRVADEDPLVGTNSRMLSIETIDSSSCRSSCDRLNSTWKDCKASCGRRYSLEEEDTSGIHTANEWSLETRSDARNTPMCLGDELAIASRECSVNLPNDRVPAINEVASFLECLQDDPEMATVLLKEEDQFYDSTSSHDQLTRLALVIETDAEEVPAILDDPNNWVQHLRDKIERLQLTNKEIHRDIRSLRTNLECDEKKISKVLNDTTKLRQDVNELKYFEDLLKLLRGELEQISKRNWPFVLGHNEPHGELNLII